MNKKLLGLLALAAMSANCVSATELSDKVKAFANQLTEATTKLKEQTSEEYKNITTAVKEQEDAIVAQINAFKEKDAKEEAELSSALNEMSTAMDTFAKETEAILGDKSVSEAVTAMKTAVDAVMPKEEVGTTPKETTDTPDIGPTQTKTARKIAEAEDIPSKTEKVVPPPRKAKEVGDKPAPESKPVAKPTTKETP